MAVVAQLSVNLAAQTTQYTKGLQQATKETKALERQVTHTQRVVRGFNATMKGLGTIGGKIGLGGVFGGALGGFQFARFAQDSIREHAKDNRELQGSLDDLDQTLLQVKKNFGAWLADVGNANGVIQGFTEGMKKLSGGDIDTRQGLVNTGRLDTNQTGDMMRESLAEAMNARDRLSADSIIAQQLEHLKGQRSASLPPESAAILERSISSLERALPQDLKNLNAEIAILERRLEELKKSGLDTEGVTEAFGQFLLKEAGDAFGKITPMAEGVGNALFDGLQMAGRELVKLDSMMQKAEEDAKDFMAAFELTRSPLTDFQTQANELTRLRNLKFIDDDTFNLALLESRQKLEDFAGLNDPIPSRVGGARRGSAEAFEKIAAFQDGTGTTVQRTLEETRDLIKEQLRLQREAAQKTRQEFDAIGTVDTKP